MFTEWQTGKNCLWLIPFLIKESYLELLLLFSLLEHFEFILEYVSTNRLFRFCRFVVNFKTISLICELARMTAISLIFFLFKISILISTQLFQSCSLVFPLRLNSNSSPDFSIRRILPILKRSLHVIKWIAHVKIKRPWKPPFSYVDNVPGSLSCWHK